jgi:hypothetical protein
VEGQPVVHWEFEDDQCSQGLDQSEYPEDDQTYQDGYLPPMEEAQYEPLWGDQALYPGNQEPGLEEPGYGQGIEDQTWDPGNQDPQEQPLYEQFWGDQTPLPVDHGQVEDDQGQGVEYDQAGYLESEILAMDGNEDVDGLSTYYEDSEALTPVEGDVTGEYQTEQY